MKEILMNLTLSIPLLIIGVIAFSLKELQAHGKLKWMGKGFGFWGEDSYLRKFKNGHHDKSKFQVVIPSDNWYYNSFKIRYREAFPGSATIFVTFTDGFHLMQFAFKIFLIASLVTYQEMVNPFWDSLIYFSIWQLVFNIVYRELSK